MYIAIAVAAALLGADRVLKYLSRTGKLRLESKYLRLTHLENRGFFLGLGQTHEKLLRWLPMGVWLLAAVCLLPELGKRVFSAQLGILLVLLGGLSNQFDRLRRGSVTDYLQFPHRRAKKRALVWNLADFMLIGGYCPCRLARTEENKCMCKEFKDQIADPNFEGYCHCRLYYKEK